MCGRMIALSCHCPGVMFIQVTEKDSMFALNNGCNILWNQNFAEGTLLGRGVGAERDTEREWRSGHREVSEG